MTKAVFLDRDGVINVNCPRAHDYIKSPEEFELLPNAVVGIRRLNEAGYTLVVVTNQRGVARGMMTMEDVADVHQAMLYALQEGGAKLDGIYVCPHDYDECDCRKPQPGLLLRAMNEMNIDPTESWMIGDHLSDVEAGKGAGVRTILIGGDRSGAADFVCCDLLDAANLIIDRS